MASSRSVSWLVRLNTGPDGAETTKVGVPARVGALDVAPDREEASMQEGDLADGPLPDILRLLAAARATGGVHVRRRDERGESADAVLFLREGRLYAATAPGPRPLLGVRLVAAGAVTREALEEALESQAGELAGWRLGELLVHLGYVDGEIVAEFVVEQILDTVAEVSAWVAGGWRFRRGEKTREADGLSLDIEDVLERVIERRQSWNDLEEYAGGATAVPQRVEIDEALTAQQIPLAQALLGEVDGVRTLAELATRCGLTTYEAGYVLAQLVEVGAVRLAPRDATSTPEQPSLPVAKIVAAVAAHPPVVAAPEPLAAPHPAEPEVTFDAEDPLGLADLLGTGLLDTGLAETLPAVPAAPIDEAFPAASAVEPPAATPAETLDPAPHSEPEPTSLDDDLAALFGGVADGDEVDLGTQLAVLARQAEEARWAAEARRRDEVRARRAGAKASAASPVEPSPPAAPAPHVPIGLSPLPDESLPPQVEDAPLVEPFGEIDQVERVAEVSEVSDVSEGGDLATPLVAPYEPIGLAPIETYGLSVADEPEPAEVDQTAFEVAEIVQIAEVAEVAEVAQAAGIDEDAATFDESPDESPADTVSETTVEAVAKPTVEMPASDSGLAARIPRLPTRSAPATAEQLEDDLPGALANLRGAIDLEALDAPDPVENAWPAMDEADRPVAPMHAPAWASRDLQDGADRNELQSALSAFGEADDAAGDVPEDAEWAEAGPGMAWHAEEAHDFTPDDEQPSTDTAALLRELSFLGLEDMPAPPRSPAPPRTPAPRQAPVPAGKVKRKSIFGR